MDSYISETIYGLNSRLFKFAKKELSILGELEADDLESYLKLESIQSFGPTNVFSVVQEWLGVDLNSRKEFSGQLIQHVQLSLTPPQEFGEVYFKWHKWFGENPESDKIVQSARRYQNATLRKRVLMQTAGTTLPGSECLVILGGKGSKGDLNQMIYLLASSFNPWWCLAAQPRVSFSQDVSVVTVNNFMMVYDRQKE